MLTFLFAGVIISWALAFILALELHITRVDVKMNRFVFDSHERAIHRGTMSSGFRDIYRRLSALEKNHLNESKSVVNGTFKEGEVFTVPFMPKMIIIRPTEEHDAET